VLSCSAASVSPSTQPCDHEVVRVAVSVGAEQTVERGRKRVLAPGHLLYGPTPYTEVVALARSCRAIPSGAPYGTRRREASRR
jgi:hypothetical protein